MSISFIRYAESHTGLTGSVYEASYSFSVGQASDYEILFAGFDPFGMNGIFGV